MSDRSALHAISPPRRAGTVRVVTWNCHGAVGGDRRCDPERILATLRRLDPDILSLQEVDGRTHFGRRPRAFEFFAEALGKHMIEARTVPRPDRDHGHLLWSRYPIDRAVVHWLPGPRVERRAALEARVVMPGHEPFRVFGNHFGLLPPGRANQALALAAQIGAAPGRWIAMGDFNEWRLHGRVARTLSALGGECIAPLSFPAGRPRVRMDRIHLSPGWKVSQSFADAEAGRASDHLPVVADLEPS